MLFYKMEWVIVLKPEPQCVYQVLDCTREPAHRKWRKRVTAAVRTAVVWWVTA